MISFLQKLRHVAFVFSDSGHSLAPQLTGKILIDAMRRFHDFVEDTVKKMPRRRAATSCSSLELEKANQNLHEVSEAIISIVTVVLPPPPLNPRLSP
jgi:hypothetical protein